MKAWSFQAKLVASFMLVISVVLVAVFASSSLFIRDRMLAEKQQDLTLKGIEIAKKIAVSRENSVTRINLGEILSDIDIYLDSRIWLLDGNRQPIGYSRSNSGNRSSFSASPSSAGAQSALRSLTSELDSVFRGEIWTKVLEHPLYEERMVVVGVPVILSNGKIDGAVVINSPVVAVTSFMRHIYWFVGIGAIVGILFSFIAIHFLTRSLFRPLRAMQASTGAIATGNYSARVAVASHDEIGKLGDSINRLAEDLGRSMLELGKTEKLRRDFIANVSHELRTPVTVIRGFSEAILDGTVESRDKIFRYIRLVCDEAIRLERLIHTLLDLSKLQSAETKCLLAVVDLAEASEHVRQLIEPLADSKQIRLDFSINAALPPLPANRDRLIQLLLILLDNAIKYSPSGSTVSLVASHTDAAYLDCVIQDNGIGIAPEDLPYIWERFYKSDKSHRRDDGSTGLGLAIARQIIDLHQARVEIHSEPGKGTQIRLRFRLAFSEDLPTG